MRFALLAGAAGLVSFAASSSLVACSSSNATGGTPDASVPAEGGTTPDGGADTGSGDDSSSLPPTPPGWDQPVTRPDDGTAATGRSNCTFVRGDMPAKTLGSSTPVDSDIPIDTVVVVMMENRSFDSMFGHLNEAANRTDVQEPPAGASNPSQLGGVADAGAEAGADGGTADAGAADSGVVSEPWMHAPALCFSDTDHSWKAQHGSWDNGANDGFYVNNNAPGDAGGAGSPIDGERAMWWYDQTDIPFDYQLASTFAIADNYFCSVLGPTNPNRMYLHAATSFGLTFNTVPNNISLNIVDNVVVSDELEQRHTSWGVYTSGTPGLAAVLQIGVATRYGRTINFSFQNFLDDAKAGTLPHVVFLDPNIGAGDGTPTNNDDHPPADVQEGSVFLSQVYNAVTTSPQWAHTALFITWDENGGIYDHLPPAKACAPDTTAPVLNGTDVGVAGDFTRYGFRVPLLVVSPYAKKGYAGHGVYDHASITRFIETKFKIPALTARDANADPLMDLFDFKNPPAFLTAPSIPTPTVDATKLQYCTQIYGH